jgi:CDP-6-deoxy-D-xylo-4-hexulose-3-dehydrase
MKISESVAGFIKTLQDSGEDLFPYLANKGKNFDSSVDTVYYSGPFWDTEEVQIAIETLLKGKWLTSGENVNKFERRFSKQFGFSESLMVNSGSSANLVMVAALKKYFGWQDGDEIIVSVVGFPTTVSAIIQNNLKPVFVDVTWKDLNWDLEKIEDLISEKTRAVFSSPVLGNPYDLDVLIEILEKHSLLLISDNCDSLGSKWNGKYLTEYSIAASCSFYPAHHICTMEGGMVSSKNTDLVKLARSYAWWGRACYCVGKQNLLPNGTCKERFSNWIPSCPVKVDHKYVFDNIGYNLKPIDLQGAIGIVQLEKFDQIERLRKQNKLRIDKIFDKIPGCHVIKSLPKSETSWFGAPIVCGESELKSSLVAHLEANRIQTRNYFAGNLLMQPGYSHLGNFENFPIASQVLEKVFFVGVSPTITSEMLDYVEKVVDDFMAQKN